MKLQDLAVALLFGVCCFESATARKTRIRGTIDNLDFLVEADGHTRVHPRMLQASKNFLPLTCNSGVTWSCVPWSFGLNPTDVEIPCGTCYNMDAFTNNEVITLSGSLNIKGRLVFNDGTKVTLKTTGVIVEGELAMTSTKPIDGTPDIVIELTGTDDVMFTPDTTNSDACGGNFAPCNLGPKPIVVAGGKLDINGMSDTCPTWFLVEDVVASGKPNPIEYMKRPALPTSSAGACHENLINESFEGGLNGWYGNLGAEESIEVGSHDNTSYLKVSKRTLSGAGPMIEIPSTLRECVLADTDYFFSAKVKIEPGPEFAGSQSTCHTSQTGCPKLRFSHMQDTDYVRWTDLISTDGVVPIQDGQWFEMKGVVSLTADWIAASDVFSLFTINEVEPGIDISVDDVKLTLPPQSAFPDPADVCGDLIRNGGADALGGFTFPMYSYIWYKSLGVKEENGNPYFTMTNREQYYDSLAVELNPGCLQAGSIYTFSSKIRVNTATAVQPRVALKMHDSSGNTEYGFLHSGCPSTSSSIGWTTCTTNFKFDTKHATAKRVELFFIISGTLDDVDFDDISLTYSGSTALAGMKLQNGSGIDSCYAPGTEVVVTSNDLDFNSAQIGTISTVHSTGTVDVTESLNRITTKTEAVDYATELAILSRNILFRPGDADVIGPSLTVLNTPGVDQKIQGVEITGFGAAGVLGRHPINFKMSGDSTGSTVQRNTVRSSKNRCINLHSTDNVDVSDNVSYDNSGHCYALQNGDEVGNKFSRNIGIGTKLGTIAPGSGETDNQASVYYITNPQNSYSSNVAAGSEGHGFWFDLTSTLSKLNIPAFSDNIAHSTLIGFKTFPWGLQPTNTNTWVNTKAYKNRAQGIFFHNSENVIVQGGSVADNKIGIEINEADKIIVRNVKIEGFTSEYKALVDLESRSSHCASTLTDNVIIGIRLHANGMVSGMPGSTIDNVDFSFFGSSTGCSSASSALAFNSGYTTASFTTSVTMTGLTFNVGAATYEQLSLCGISSAGVKNIYMEDTDGSLNPSGTGAGMIVSDDPNFAVFSSCTPLAGTCAQFCAGVSVSDVKNAMPSTPASTPSASTPAATPTAPIPVVDICLDNEDFEAGTQRWFGVKSVLSTTTGFGGTGVAVKATNRDHQARGGAWQRFSPTCMIQGQYYVIRADVKLTEANTDNVFKCDPTIKWLNADSCAAISLLVGTNLVDVAYTVGPYNSNGWNEVYGVFEATAEMMAESTIGLMVSRAPNTVDITVDNVALGLASGNEVGISTCASPIVNGNAETGDHRYWFIRGHGNNGQIAMDSGYPNGSGYSFKHTGIRTEPRASIMQFLDGSCFTAGSTWDISFYWKVYDSTETAVACDKSTTAASNSCPSVTFIAGGTANSPIITNTDTSAMLIGKWNAFTASYTVDSSLAGFPDFWIVLYVPSDLLYSVDNIVLTKTS